MTRVAGVRVHRRARNAHATVPRRRDHLQSASWPAGEKVTGLRPAGYARVVSASVLVCGTVFDGVSAEPGKRAEVLVRDGLIAAIGRSVDRPDGAEVIDLSQRTVTPGFIDTHVHLTMDASDLAQQTLESSA